MAGAYRSQPPNQRPSQNPRTAQNASQTQLAKTEQGFTVQDLLKNFKGRIEAALPRHMTAERMIRVALTSIFKNKDLMGADPLSVAGAIVQASELGLEPNGVLGHAYLVPFKNKEHGYRLECQLMVGYKGFVDLARRSGKVQTINAHLVYSNDVFDCALGTDEYVKHVPYIWKDGRNGKEAVSAEERGAMVLTYAFAKLIEGGSALEVMGIPQVEKIRENAPSPNSPAWKNHYEWMVRKTVIKQLCKLLPLSVEMQTATGLEDQADAGLSQNLENALVDADRVVYSVPTSAETVSETGRDPEPGPEAGPEPTGATQPPPAQDKGNPTQPPPPRQQERPRQEQRPPREPQQEGFAGRTLSTDDFSPEDLTALQGCLRYATSKLPPAEQINNRARVNAWLAQNQFANPQAALAKADEMKFDAEPKD